MWVCLLWLGQAHPWQSWTHVAFMKADAGSGERHHSAGAADELVHADCTGSKIVATSRSIPPEDIYPLEETGDLVGRL